MGASGFGIYSYVIACVTLIGLPLQAGLPTLTTREVASFKASNNYRAIKGLIWRSLQLLTMISGLVVCLALFLTVLTILPISEPHQPLLILGAALMSLTAWTGFFGAALIGSGRLIAGQLPEAAIRPVFFILFVAILAVICQLDLTPQLVLSCAVAAAFIAALFAAIRFFGEYGFSLRGLTPGYETRRWLRSLIPLAFFGVTTTLLAQTDILLLGVFSTTSTVGVYKVSVVGSSLVAFGLNVINTVNAPQYAALSAKDDRSGIESLAFNAARLATAFAVTLFAAYLILGGDMLMLVFGAEYVGALSMMIILAMAQVVNCFTGSAGLILNSMNMEGRAATAVAVAAGLNVVLNLVLIPRFGANGAAIATGISLAVSNALMWYSIKTKLGIDVSAWPLVR